MSLQRQESLRKRHLRVRQKISGTAARPRLCIHRSLRHLYAQLVDDTAGQTLAFATTNQKTKKSEAKTFANKTFAQKLGVEIAQLAAAKGIAQVVFDRSGYPYHGVVKVFAEAAREGGLKF